MLAGVHDSEMIMPDRGGIANEFRNFHERGRLSAGRRRRAGAYPSDDQLPRLGGRFGQCRAMDAQQQRRR